MDLVSYFFLSLLFSTLFSMGGVGSAIALVTIFPMAGMPTMLAKTVSLFINASSTISASIMNLIRGVLDFKFAIPLVLSIIISTPLGAYLSQYIAEYWLTWLLIAFLLISAIASDTTIKKLIVQTLQLLSFYFQKATIIELKFRLN